MSEAPSYQVPIDSPRGSTRPPLKDALARVALFFLCTYIGLAGMDLWTEYGKLRFQMERVRATATIGYPGIGRQPTFARRPSNWIHDEGDSTLFWSGWKDGEGHGWFRVARGEIDPSRMSFPAGRDSIVAIDAPLIERNGGAIWNRIPDDADVIGHQLGEVDTVYPVLILERVLIINDTVAGQPYLITYNAALPSPDRSAVCAPVVDGTRLTLGFSGYLHDGNLLLYDRATESLWILDRDGLLAIAGRYKGRRLSPIARPHPVTWADWRSAHPKSRLVVGNDRSKPMPKL